MAGGGQVPLNRRRAVKDWLRPGRCRLLQEQEALFNRAAAAVDADTGAEGLCRREDLYSLCRVGVVGVVDQIVEAQPGGVGRRAKDVADEAGRRLDPAILGAHGFSTG